MTGYLEPTNEPYAIAKIAGIKMCESYNREYKTDYRSVLPCNLYGMNDSYDELNGHITAGMIRRFHSAKVSGAKEVSVWGTGKPRREFLYGDDLAEACVIAMNVPLEEWQTQVPPRCNMVNIGSGTEQAIDEFAAMVARVVGYTGAITFDSTSPDGVFSKLSDSTKMRSFGWTPKTTLQEGLYRAYLDYRQRVIK